MIGWSRRSGQTFRVTPFGLRHRVTLKEDEGIAMLREGWVSSVHWIDRLKTMGEQPSKFSCFLAELRRRHVLGYAAVAFVVLQLGEIVLPAFSLENWSW